MRIAGAGLEKPCCRGLLLLLLLLLFLPRSILSMSLSRPSNNLRIRSTQLELTKHLTGSPTSSFLLAADFRPSSALPELETQTPQLSVSRQPAETRWRSLEVGTLPLFPILCSRECKWQSPSDSANDTLHDPRSMLCRKFCYCRYTTEVLVFFPPVILAAACQTNTKDRSSAISLLCCDSRRPRLYDGLPVLPSQAPYPANQTLKASGTSLQRFSDPRSLAAHHTSLSVLLTVSVGRRLELATAFLRPGPIGRRDSVSLQAGWHRK